MKKITHQLIIICLLFTGINNSYSQKLKSPEASQAAMVMQRIGLTDITISYHSPLAKNRKIWDGLVPLGKVWRAGANENTTFGISTDVNIEGKKLAAGTYGLHIIPNSGEWTIIFSKNSSSWGSFFYDISEDVLRVKVNPLESEYQDWLSYSFTEIQNNSVNLNLRWEKITAIIKINIDENETVYQSMAEEMRGLNSFTWEAPLQASSYCLNNNIHLEQGKRWLEQSIKTQENSTNMLVMAKYLLLEGKTQEAAAMTNKAIEVSNEAALNTYGYSLLGENKIVEAIEIFILNVKRHPDSWNVFDSLAEGYELNKNKKEALTNYKIALSKAPENQHSRINQTIKKIETQ